MAKANDLVGVGIPAPAAEALSRAALHSTATVSATPSDAELDSAFGTPGAVGAGFLGVVDDNLVVSDGTNWRFVALTTAS